MKDYRIVKVVALIPENEIASGIGDGLPNITIVGCGNQLKRGNEMWSTNERVSRKQLLAIIEPIESSEGTVHP